MELESCHLNDTTFFFVDTAHCISQNKYQDHVPDSLLFVIIIDSFRYYRILKLIRRYKCY